MTHDKIQSVFDVWARNGRAEGMEQGHGDVVRQVIARMKFRPGQQILDLGCGNGWATRALAKSAAGSSAIGIDVSTAMIARAEELTSLTIRARYEVGRFEELPLRDASIDKVFSMEAIYYAVDLDRALREIHRVLKPSGTLDLVLDCYAERPTTDRWSAMVGLPMQRLSEKDWIARLANAGFRDVASERVVDSRGPGDRATFTPNDHCPDWETACALHESGSLWLHATKA